MDTRPEPPLEGGLINEALARSGLSARKAAKQAGISEGWWRQIVRGYQTLSGGGYGPVKGPPETVARMAQVVGVTPEELADAGRDDAARVLRGLEAGQAAERATQDAASGGPDDPRWRMLEATLTAAGEGLSRRERAELRRNIERFLAENPAWQPGQPNDDEPDEPRHAG